MQPVGQSRVCVARCEQPADARWHRAWLFGDDGVCAATESLADVRQPLRIGGYGHIVLVQKDIRPRSDDELRRAGDAKVRRQVRFDLASIGRSSVRTAPIGEEAVLSDEDDLDDFDDDDAENLEEGARDPLVGGIP